MNSLVGTAAHRRPRRARRDVYYGGAAAPSATSREGFGEAPPLRHRARGAAAAEPEAVSAAQARRNLSSRARD